MLHLKFLVICFFLIQIVTAQNINQNTAIIRRTVKIIEQKENDSVAIVSVTLPAFSSITIKEKTVAALHKSYANSKDNLDTLLAVGKCHLIKGNTYYFGMRLTTDFPIEEGDILTFKVELPECYEGLLFTMSNNEIQFMTIEEKEFFNIETPYLLSKADEEGKYLKHMVSDIQYTGKEMLKQMPESNNILKEGIYKDTPLFTAMQKTTLHDLKEFLKYVSARPKKYAGSQWKISEIYATWLFSGSPQVVDAKN